MHFFLSFVEIFPIAFLPDKYHFSYLILQGVKLVIQPILQMHMTGFTLKMFTTLKQDDFLSWFNSEKHVKRWTIFAIQMSIILINNIQRHFETGWCWELLALTRITPCEKVSTENLQHINEKIIVLYNQHILENKHTPQRICT